VGGDPGGGNPGRRGVQGCSSAHNEWGGGGGGGGTVFFFKGDDGNITGKLFGGGNVFWKKRCGGISPGGNPELGGVWKSFSKLRGPGQVLEEFASRTV